MVYSLNFVSMNTGFTNTLSVSGLSVGYDGKVVAGGLTAEFRGGSLTCLVGRNGTGKTTLLRTLAGFMPPIAGSVELAVDGGRCDVWRCSRQRLARLVAVVLTEKADLANISVGEVVAMGRMPYTNFFGSLGSRDRRIVAEALEATGMTAFADRDFCRLSDGERQKVMMARALAQQTPVVLLDEPTAFLDFPTKRETMAMLARMAEDMGKIVIASTHDLGVASAIAHRIVTIDNGMKDVNPKDLQL